MENKIFDAIKYSLQYRMFENALLLCQELYSLEKTPQCIYYFAKTYLESSNPQQSVMLCRQNLELVFKMPELAMVYVQSLFESGKYTEAESMIKKARESFSKMSKDLKTAFEYYYGLVLVRTHRHEKASEIYEILHKKNPLIVSAIQYINNKQNISELTKTAQIMKSETPEKTIMNLPVKMQQSVEALYHVALQFFRKSKYNEAAATFSKMYELHPHTMVGIDIYSTTLWQLKDEKKLAFLVQRCLDLAPGRSQTWIANGNLLSLQHNTDAAVQMFQRAANIDKSCSYALALAGHELLGLDSLSDATKFFREALDRNPSEWSAWYGLGSVHFKQDNFKAAKYYMEKALILNSSSSVLHYVHGMVLRKCGDNEGAKIEFNTAIELDPANLIPMYQLGVLAAEDDCCEALEYLDKADALAPHEPGIAYHKAKVLYNIGDSSGAAQMYANALIYGHPDKKEIYQSIDNIIENVISDYLKS